MNFYYLLIKKDFCCFLLAKKNDKINIKKKFSFIRLPFYFILLGKERDYKQNNFIKVRIPRNKKLFFLYFLILMRIICVNNKGKFKENEIFI